MFVWTMKNIKILYYDRVDVSEGIDVNKTSESKECDICHYRYFFDKGFSFQPHTCNRWHDLLMSRKLSDTAILNIKGTDYHGIISDRISKSEAVRLNAKCRFDQRKWNVIKQNIYYHI